MEFLCVAIPRILPASASATAPTGYGDGQRDRRRNRLIVELIDCQIDSFSKRDSLYELELWHNKQLKCIYRVQAMPEKAFKT